MVPAGAPRATGLGGARVLRLERHRPEVQGRAHHLHRHREVQLDLGPEAKQYYWHRFFSHQPDLNFENPQVLREVLDALGYWAELGVDAFRLDAVPYLIEQDAGAARTSLARTRSSRTSAATWTRPFPAACCSPRRTSGPTTSARTSGTATSATWRSTSRSPRIFMALRLEDVEPIVEIMRRTPPIPDTCQWALFLRNHDELTLEMVTTDERDYMYLAYRQDPRMKLNVGIRRRLMPLVENSRRRMEL